MQIFLYTIILGSQLFDRMTSPYFPSFQKSLEGNNVAKIIIFGDQSSPHKKILPKNFIYKQVSWKDISARLDSELGTKISSLYTNMTHSNYKINDFKTLIPMLYPGLFAEYNRTQTRLLGWIDNDMWFSTQLFRGLERKRKGKHITHWSGIPPNPAPMSWGPITILDRDLYFKTLVPLVKSHVHLLLPVLMDPHEYRCYDEWGEVKWGGLGFQHSFSYILSKADIITDFSFIGNALQTDVQCCTSDSPRDKSCQVVNPNDQSCGYCQMSWENRKVVLRNYKNETIYFCHFQRSKRSNPNMFSSNDLWQKYLSKLKKKRPIISNILKGIHFE